MSDAPFTDWLLTRPEQIQRLAIDWPPNAIVRAKPGVTLVCPAPGQTGRVASWFENGNVGIDNGVFRAECDPKQLELVDFVVVGETTVDHDVIRGIVEGRES